MLAVATIDVAGESAEQLLAREEKTGPIDLDLGDLEALAAEWPDDTGMVWLETPSNPMLEIMAKSLSGS